MTNSPIVVHIPHSGVLIPDKYLVDYIISPEQLLFETQFYCDSFTDVLFSPLSKSFSHIINPYNRILFDVERFDDDLKEPMSKFGLGWFYENSPFDGKPLRVNTHKKELHHLYSEHHRQLSTLVKNSLEQFNKCLIIDCHSFNPNNTWFQTGNDEFPDICIGFDDFHNNEKVVALFTHHFKQFKIAFNTPYNGSIVPYEHFLTNPNVSSIMIEVNKKIYLSPEHQLLDNNVSEFHKLLMLFITDLHLIFSNSHQI